MISGSKAIKRVEGLRRILASKFAADNLRPVHSYPGNLTGDIELLKRLADESDSISWIDTALKI